MLVNLSYIGPGLGMGTMILVIAISGIVLFSLGYIIYLKVKNFLNKKK